jgi:hypothetical protein
MDWPTGWAFDLDDGGAPTPPAPSPAPAAPLGERKEQVATVAEAVAEIERRAAERRAQRKAEKAEREDAVAAKRQKTAADVEQLRQEAEGEDDPDDEDEDLDEGNAPDAKSKAKKTAKAEDADESDDDDEDTEDGGKKKSRRASDDDSEDDDGDVTTDDGPDDDDSTSTIQIDGRELSIPKGTPKAVREALAKMSTDLKADHTRKTQEVAQARQVLMQRAQQADSMVQQALHAQDVIVQMAQQMIGRPPPLELAQTDIQQYTIQKALYEQRVAQLQGLGGHTQQLRQAQAQAQAQQRDQMLAQEAQHMVRFMPALARPENRQRFMAEASAVAAKSGFSPQDVATVGDHRMLHLLGRLIEAEARLAAYGKAGASTKQRLANVPPKVRSSDSAAADQGKGQKAARAKQDFMRSKRSLQDVRRYLRATDT